MLLLHGTPTGEIGLGVIFLLTISIGALSEPKEYEPRQFSRFRTPSTCLWLKVQACDGNGRGVSMSHCQNCGTTLSGTVAACTTCGHVTPSEPTSTRQRPASDPTNTALPPRSAFSHEKASFAHKPSPPQVSPTRHRRHVEGRIVAAVATDMTQTQHGSSSLVPLIPIVAVVGIVGYLWSQRTLIIAHMFFPVLILVLLGIFFRPARRVLGFLCSVLGRLLSIIVGGLRWGQRSPVASERVINVPVHRFRITDADGTQHECLLRGELIGGSLRMGDAVVVQGIRKRNSALVAHRVTVSATGTVVSAKMPPGAWSLPNLVVAIAALCILSAAVVLAVRV